VCDLQENVQVEGLNMERVFDSPFGRVYGFGDKYYSSVTTILSGFNPNSQNFTNDYAQLGTRCHYEILGLYKDMEEPDIYYNRFSQQEVNAKLDMANDMWQTVDVGNVIDVEMAVRDDINCYAGRLDMITELAGKITMVDLKTGNYYAKYPLQIAAYCHAYNGDVEQALIVRLDLNLDRNPDCEVDLIWYDRAQLDEYEAKFIEKCKKYNRDQQDYIDAMAKR
jgi:hypothetical protein